MRFEQIELDRTAFDFDGMLRSADGYPFSKRWTPVTGRVGYTWEALPGLIFYSQYATAADPAVANIFILRPTQPLLLTTSRTYETGVKQLFWDNRAEWTFSAFDIERNNVYVAPRAAMPFNIAGECNRRASNSPARCSPFDGLKLWGNVAFVEARYVDFMDFDNGDVFYRQHAAERAALRRQCRRVLPLRDAVAGRGRRRRSAMSATASTSRTTSSSMEAYTVATRLPSSTSRKPGFPLRASTRRAFTFRVRNLTDKLYAVWGDPGYPDQIILGAPRSYEVSASFKW